MQTPKSGDYISNRAWLRSFAAGEDLILRNVSALEYLELFAGYLHEPDIEVYARQKGEYENVNYCVVDTFDEIDHVRIDGVMCSTLSQVVNDMLDDFENADEQALVEALANYYFSGNSYERLNIKPENKELFEEMKNQAAEFYCWE